MKKFSDKINEGKDLSYETFFGKKITHIDALHKRIRDLITNIIMDEQEVSEKDFTNVDRIMKEVNDKLNSDIYKEVETLYNNNKRLNYIAEIIYEKYFI